MIFFYLVYDLLACNKKAEILPLATALIAYLRSQFNHVFALLVFMPCFKSINFYQDVPEIKLFLQKNCKIYKLHPQIFLPLAVGGNSAHGPPI